MVYLKLTVVAPDCVVNAHANSRQNQQSAYYTKHLDEGKGDGLKIKAICRIVSANLQG